MILIHSCIYEQIKIRIADLAGLAMENHLNQVRFAVLAALEKMRAGEEIAQEFRKGE